MKNFAVFIFILELCPFVDAAAADSLCKEDETTYFSCNVADSQKMISLCGKLPEHVSDVEDPDALVSQQAFLTYRFGTRQKIELEYPRGRKNSLKQFEGVWLQSHYGSVLEVYFRIGKYAYGVFFSESEEVGVLSGVNVFGNSSIEGSPLKTISCQKGTRSDSLFQVVHILDEFGGLVVRHPANVPH